MRRRLLQLSLGLLLVPLLAAGAAPDVKIEPRGSGYAIRVESDINADAGISWQVITDYNHLADFVPDMRASRIISAAGQPLQIEQTGKAGFLIFRFTLDVVLEIEETPPLKLTFRAIRGNMRHMRGEWRIDKSTQGIRLVYAAELEPSFWVPPLIGPAVLRNDISNQVAGVVREIERRQAAFPSPQKSTPEK